MSLGTSAIRRSGCVLLVVLLLCLVARAAPGPQDDSIRARLKACLLMGDMQCVVTQYMVLKDLGRMPDWLVAFQNAFAVANRRAGECEKVARAIHQGLAEFAQKPVFIRFSVEGKYSQLGFDVLEKGVFVKNLQISSNGYHVAVKLGDRVIDAYTGLAGLPLHEYMARLTTRPGSHVIQQVVEGL
ncbi:hypothetical protein JQX13_22225 [Archangium violaceum]|uniref:hypothetical protein n=1 Tax=Archangium violaceum TaxID=83451 RepID=UPI00193B7962|nr:hypothetical protein [Archangium violaceum]QRK12501.1 hypothetical protein JQX13_22225 [Archangium violaceum]